MKNYVRLSVFLFVLLLALGGCNIKFEDETTLTNPSVEATPGGNVIGIKKYSSDISVINIYRADVTGGASNPAEIIGLIYPSNYVGGDVYLFTDELVLKDHSYKYYVRVCDDGNYLNSEWSAAVKTVQATYAEGGTALPKPATPSAFNYTSSDHKLTYTIDTTGWITGYSYALIFQESGKEHIMKLPDLAATPTPGTNEVVSMSGLFSQYMDREIKITGICGQKIELNSSNEKMRVYWTKSAPVSLTFNIPSSSGGNVEDL